MITNIQMRLPALIVYVVSLSLAAMYTVNLKHYILCAALMSGAAITLMLIMLFVDRKITTKIMMGMGVTAMASAALVFCFMGNENAGFLEYLFSGSSIGFDTGWAVLSAVVLGLVVGYICFYFALFFDGTFWTISALFLVAMLATRTMGTLPLWMIVFITCSYVMVLAGSNKCNTIYQIRVRDFMSRYMIASALMAVAVIAAALIPKSVSMSGKELVNELVLGTGGYNYNLASFRESSSVNVGDNRWRNQELFRVRADEPVNLVYGGFDEYNGEQGWTTLDYYNRGYPEIGYSEMNIGNMINRMKKAVSEGLLEEYADKFKGIPASEAGIGQMRIIHDPNGVSQVVIHPVGTYYAEVLNETRGGTPARVFATPRHEMFSNEDFIGLEYDLKYFDSEINARFSNAFTPEELESLLRSASNEGVLSQIAVEMYLDEMREAEYYQEMTAYKGVSYNIKCLADEIVAGAETDYDKLKRIMRWFEDEDFIYDLEYVPKESTAEYFLFESKRGICSDFATAAALLCRGAGLAAIYTEGFAMDEDNMSEDGEYIITDANAHAFVQVYINGHGWYCLDATGFAETAEEFELPQEMLIVLAVIAGLLFVLSLAVYLLRKPFAEFWFAVSYRAVSPDKAVKGILVRMRREAGRIAGRRADTMTAQDTARIIYSLGLTAEAQRFMSACDRVSYGAGDTGRQEPPILYRDYKTLLAIRRQRKC